MKYNFSPLFLKVLPPDTNFGEAWESLCFDLLSEAFSEKFNKINSPDQGIDIFSKERNEAYQCKSDERGALGSIGSDESIKSLASAIKNKNLFNWNKYLFSTNANYTGHAMKNILEYANANGLDINSIEFNGPEYWDKLCDKHFDKVKKKFDFRLIVSENQVLEAFMKARYFDNYIKQYYEQIKNSNFKIVIKNNRTPLEYEIPFSQELSVENLVDVGQVLMGISLDWNNFNDVQTSAGPSISLTINQKSQPFSTKIGQLNLGSEDKLELWVKIIWQDDLNKEKGRDSSNLILKQH